MFCIKCHNEDTRVTNSRSHTKEPRVWRRRRCPRCGADFTTLENPVLSGSCTVTNATNSNQEPFYHGKLIASIAKSFAHDEQYGAINSLPLSNSVISQLVPVGDSISTEYIKNRTYVVLQRFDPNAATQYALAHHIAMRGARRRKGL